MTDIAAIIKVFMEPGPKTGHPGRPVLRPGTMLNGKITDILPSGVLQINFGKFRTQTRVRFPVAKGDTLRFEVLENGDQIKLKIQDQPPAANKAPIQQSFKPEDLQRLSQLLETRVPKPDSSGFERVSTDRLTLQMVRLSRLLLPLQTGRAPEQLAPLIKALLTNAGVFFEKRLETVLLQIFKSPENIDVGRAAAHPFVTNIFDSDLKPNLLKLALALEPSGNKQNRNQAPLQKVVRNFIRHIEQEQSRLIRSTPAGSGKTAPAYRQTGSTLAELPKIRTDLPVENIKTLQQQLVKSGLWSDPKIRTLLRAKALPANTGGGQSAARPSGPGQWHLPAADRAGIDPAPIDKTSLLKDLTGMANRNRGLRSNKLAPLLTKYRAYVQANRLQLDSQTEKTLHRLENLSRPPAPRSGPPASATGPRAAAGRQDLEVLVRFVTNPPAEVKRAVSPALSVTPKGTRPATPPGDPARVLSRESNPVAEPAAPRSAPRAAGRSIAKIVALVEPRAAALRIELDHIDKALTALQNQGNNPPAARKPAQAARSLQTVIERHQLPTDEAVSRVITTLVSGKPATGKTPATIITSSPASETLRQDLVLLRDFIGLQKAALNEVMETLRGLSDRPDLDLETGDRPGSDRGRGTDPLQVIAFTLPMEEGRKPARLKVFYPLKRNASAGSGFRISLLLSMERMGSVRADILAHPKNLEVKFSTENETVCRHINSHLSHLGDLLEGAFETVNLTATVDDKNIAAFEYEDLELSGDRLVDLQA